MYLSVYLSVCLFIFLLICLSVCLSVFACRFCIGVAPGFLIPFVWNKTFCNSACLFIYIFLPYCFCDDVTLRWCPENPYLKSASVSHEKELYDDITQGIKQGIYLLWLGLPMRVFMFPGSGAGVTPVAGPIFGPQSTRLIEGFHFEDCLICRFYFVSNLVGKDFSTKEHLTRIRTFVENVFTVSFPKRTK